MANALYDFYRELSLAGSVSANKGTVQMCYISTAAGYTYSSGHTAFAQVSPYMVGTASSAFAGVTVSTGIFNANNMTIQAIPATGGSVIGAIVIYGIGYSWGTPLIAYIDNAAGGLPVTPNGGDITTAWSAGTYKIFKL